MLGGAGAPLGISYGNVTRYFELPAIRYDVRLVAPGAVDCGRALVPDVTDLPALPDGASATIAALGKLDHDGTGEPFAVRAYLDDAEVAAGQAKLRFVRSSPPRPRRRAPVIVAWIAAAACLALAVGAVLWARGQERVPVIAAAPPPAEARAELLATAGDAATLAWQAASGDVVWSPSKQRGYMRFRGLAPNDPKVAQYQLWIFDKRRDERFPVDGGVFDVTSDGEVIVPISAKLPVGDAVLFAVTVEAPGGVVVSKRERIVVTAAPAKAG